MKRCNHTTDYIGDCWVCENARKDQTISDLRAQLADAELAKHQASALRRDADDELEAVTSERDALRETVRLAHYWVQHSTFENDGATHARRVLFNSMIGWPLTAAPAEEDDDDPDPLAWVEDSHWAEEGKG